jgi:hypothetical protein
MTKTSILDAMNKIDDKNQKHFKPQKNTTKNSNSTNTNTTNTNNSNSTNTNTTNTNNSNSTNTNTTNTTNTNDGISKENTNNSVLVIILKCDKKLKETNINNLKWVFSDPYFITQVKSFEPSQKPSGLGDMITPPILTEPNIAYTENYCMYQALTYAAEGPYVINADGSITKEGLWTNLPVIIVKDNSVSNITPSGITNSSQDKIIGGMKNRIQIALQKAQSADLYYLARWNDNCTKNTLVAGTESIDKGSSLQWTIKPTATQAIMYTPKSRDIVSNALCTMASNISLSDYLNSAIYDRKFIATAFVPSIISFDTNLATSQTDFNKLNECFPVSTDTPTSSNTSLIWLIVLILVVILVASALIQLGPKYETK